MIDSQTLWARIAVLLVPAMTACSGDVERLMREVDALRTEVTQLRAASAGTTVMMEDVQNKVLLLEDQMESTRLLLGRNGTRQLLPPSEEPDSLPVVHLRPYSSEGPMVADAGSGASGSRSPGPIVFQEIDENGNIRNVDGSKVSRPAPSGSSARGDNTSAPLQKKRDYDARPVEMYKSAYQLIQDKRWSEAISAFQNLIEEYPNHDYADNALYWMGEAYYASMDYDKALQCFDKLVTLYPDGNKVPDALLKAALCNVNLGNTTEARKWASRLQATYPQTQAAAIAREKLRDLR